MELTLLQEEAANEIRHFMQFIMICTCTYKIKLLIMSKYSNRNTADHIATPLNGDILVKRLINVN